jgi:large subunit ribosomal protein L18
MYAQIIDDEKAHTLVSASNLSPELKKQFAGKSKVEQSKIIGEYLAKRAIAAGISNVVFDRSGYKYHGRIKALRAGGLKF